jgi:D-beta-D-heptose 7-phosphate kinase/D-beta-D-heptose 1-phosphate adenosyltransferase
MKPSAPDHGRLKKLLAGFAGRRLLVVGDIILDEYLMGDVNRISPEAPIPVVHLREDSLTLGAAGYVASHVRNLGGEAVLCGVVGDDSNGERLREILDGRGISGSGVFTDPGRPTSIKTRVIARHQQMLRIDRESPHPVEASLSRRMLAFVEDAVRRADGVLLIDYDKGAFTPELIRGAIRAARRAGVPVAVNPKPHLALRFRGSTVVSMNHSEAVATLKRPLPEGPALERGGQELRRRLSSDAVLVTRGEHGMAVFAGGTPLSIPTRAREVFDVTGAGDTVIAVTAMGLAAGGKMADCVHLANIAAGIEVAKLGCALVSREEIARAI